MNDNKNKPYTNEEKEIIFKMYQEGYNCKEIGEKLGKTNKAINKFLHRHNLNTNQSIYNKLTQLEIENICNLYIEGNSAKKIMQIYNEKITCENTIISILKKENIPIRDAKRFTLIKYENFFEDIDSEEKAYILGLLIADGYVIFPKRKGRNPFWGITLVSTDEYLLEKIKDIIGIDKKIINNFNLRKNGKRRNESILSITSLKMVKDLEKYGIVQNKTFSINLPTIKDELYRHLIRGFFDGDGCISKNVCSFVGNKQIMEQVQNRLIKDININKNKIYKSENKYSFMFSSKKDIENFYKYIYEDSSIYLKRKKEKFEKLSFIK